jgi:hypothetical protein
MFCYFSICSHKLCDKVTEKKCLCAFVHWTSKCEHGKSSHIIALSCCVIFFRDFILNLRIAVNHAHKHTNTKIYVQNFANIFGRAT